MRPGARTHTRGRSATLRTHAREAIAEQYARTREALSKIGPDRFTPCYVEHVINLPIPTSSGPISTGNIGPTSVASLDL